MKHTIAALSCTAALVASLAACGSEDDKATLPSNTSGSAPSTTATSRPTTATTPPAATTTGPVALSAHSTYTYGGLKVVVNLPADIPSASRPSMRLFSTFLQGVGRTTAQNKIDPSLKNLASANVMKYLRTTTVAGSIRSIGSMTFTIDTVRTGTSGLSLITGCLDQSKVREVRKDGTSYRDTTYPTLKMTANINPGADLRVTLFTFADRAC